MTPGTRHNQEPSGAWLDCVVADRGVRHLETDVRGGSGRHGQVTRCLTPACDGVTCQLGLMDIPDLGAVLSAVHRVLRPGGWFAFVIGHPCFLAPGAHPITGPDGRLAILVPEYLDERFWRSTNPNGVRRAGSHHRTVGTYLNALVAAGFALKEVVEPRASERLAAQQPVYASVPIFLAARVRTA